MSVIIIAMIDGEIRKAIHGNNLLWRCVFTDELVTNPSYDLVYTFGLEAKFMSCAQRIDLSSLPDTLLCIEEIEKHYRKRNRPVSIYLDPSTEPKNLKKILVERGYKEAKGEEEIWWEIDPKNTKQHQKPVGFEIVECTTRELFEDHLSSAMLGYKDFKFWASLMSKLFRHSLDGIDVIHYVGYMNGEPAACSSLGLYFDYAYLINTAVVDKFRRRGLHTSLMLHRLEVAAKRGVTKAFYQTDFDNVASIGTGTKTGFSESFRRNLYYLD